MRSVNPHYPDLSAPYYRGQVVTTFSAIHALPPPTSHGRPHGHDFTAEFAFESIDLVEPGVVVDEDMRAEIIHHIANRLDGRDLNALLGRPATCEAIARHLVDWYLRSAPVPIHAHLAGVAVTAGAGARAELRLPHPLQVRRHR